MKEKVTYTTISVEEGLARTFRTFCQHAGFSVSTAAEKALKRWMIEGCRLDIQEFLDKPSPPPVRPHDGVKDMIKTYTEILSADAIIVEPEDEDEKEE